MSIAALAWAFAQDCPTPSAKLVLLRLAWHANKAGDCWPSYGRLANELGLGRRTVIQQIQMLIDTGLVSFERGGGAHSNPNRYRLTGAGIAPVTGAKSAPVHFTTERVQELHPTGAGIAPKRSSRSQRKTPLAGSNARTRARAHRKSPVEKLYEGGWNALQDYIRDHDLDDPDDHQPPQSLLDGR
jgi:DNA-binding transcriptional MocR family regulator